MFVEFFIIHAIDNHVGSQPSFEVEDYFPIFSITENRLLSPNFLYPLNCRFPLQDSYFYWLAVDNYNIQHCRILSQSKGFIGLTKFSYPAN